MQFLDFSRFHFFNGAKTAEAQEEKLQAPPAPDPEQIAIEGELQKGLEKSTRWGEKLQQSKADDQSLVMEKSWLHHFPWKENPADMDFRFLALLSGDAFINGTPLEGYSFDKAMQHYINFFEMLLRQKDISEVKEIAPYFPKIQSYVDQLKACKIISEKTHKMMEDGMQADSKTRNELVKNYAEELSRDFAKGGMDWFPTGWIDTSAGGHAMLLKFEKDGTIAFVNSGGGLEYHASADVTSPDDTTRTIKHKSQQFLTLKSNNKERLGSVDFFRFLLEVNVWPTWDGSFKPDARIIYEGLFDYLGGKKESAYSPARQPHLFKVPQRSGSCTAKSISTGFYYHLCGIFGGKEKNPAQAVKLYKKTKFLWERQALIAQCSQLLPLRDQLQEVQVRNFASATEQFLEDIMKNMGREAESLHDDKLLTSEDMLSLHATFLDIRNRISVIKERQEKLSCEVMHCARDYRVPLIPDYETKIPVPSVNKPVGKLDTDNESPADRLSKEIMSIRMNPLVEPQKASETFDSWLKVLEPILSREDMRSELYHSGQKKDLAKVILNHFEDILCHIPIPDHDKQCSFWQHIPQDQILECMRSLKSMMTMLNLASHVYSEQRSAATLTLNFACLAIMEQLARRLPESNLKNEQINYYELLKKLKSPYFINPEPRVHEQLSKLLKYFDPKLTIDNAYHLTDDTLKKLSLASLFNYNDKYGIGPKLEITNKALKADPTLIYLRQFLRWDDPSVRNKLSFRGIKPADSLIDQLQGMLWVKSKKDKQESVLPECVELLQQAALHCTICCNQNKLTHYPILGAYSEIKSFDQLPNYVFVDGNCRGQGSCGDYIHWYNPEKDYKKGLLESPLTNRKRKKIAMMMMLKLY